MNAIEGKKIFDQVLKSYYRAKNQVKAIAWIMVNLLC